MKTLQEQYNAIKSGKGGDKAQFLKHARSLFPEYVNQYSTFDTATRVLKSKQIISEATTGGVVSKGFDIYDWKKILAEETKAVEKETSKEVKDANKNAYDNKDVKNADNINFNEIMKGFYCELKDEKNAGKTGDELKDIVVKNLAKDPLYYTKNGEFGTKGVGYTDEAPGLGKPKDPKGKYKSSGYGDIDTDKVEKVKANVQDSLGDKEAKTSMPKKVKEMEITPQNSKGVKKMKMPGAEKKIKLKEGLSLSQYDNMSDQLKENLYHNEIWSLQPEGRFWILTYSDINGKQEKVFQSEEEAKIWIKSNLEEDIQSEYFSNKNSISPFDEKIYENINKKYTHFAIRKSDNKIVDGWETVSDIESLKYYAKMDLKDIFPDSKLSDFIIYSKNTLIKKGIDPFDTKNWYKNDEILNENEDIYQQLEDLELELMVTDDPERAAEIEAKIKTLEDLLK